jgi:hypothetical protein
MKSIVAAMILASALSVHAQSDRFRFGGFGDAVFAYASATGHTTFDAAELDVFATAKLTDDWSILGEGFIQHARRGNDVDLPSTKRVEIDLERLSATYNPSDRVRVEIGQIHTGIIRWNAREHRGRFLQTPIDTPSIANREEQGGAWPLHFIGLWVSGRLPGALGVQYGAGAGETRGSDRDELQPVLDEKSTVARLVSIGVAPDSLAGFEAGVAAYEGNIPAHDGMMRERDATLFASFVRNGIELRSEWAEMHHRRLADGAMFVTRGWYVLASLRPRGRWESVRPYVLLDYLDVAAGESYLADVHDQDAWALGVRWDVAKNLALKGEVRSRLTAAGPRDRGARAQIAFSF